MAKCSFCNEDGRYVVYLLECKICGSYFCKDCSEHCENCEDLMCPNCLGECDECGSRFCPNCITRHICSNADEEDK